MSLVLRRLALAVAGLGLLLPALTLAATPPDAPAFTIVEYTIPTDPSDTVAITTGPDGNVWFAENSGHNIAKITPAGAITEYPVPSALMPSLTTGPDGNIWAVESDRTAILKMTPAGATTEYPVAHTVPGLHGITSGPDGNLWFTTAYYGVGLITPQGVITTWNDLSGTGYGITTGADGNLWMGEADRGRIARLTPNGTGHPGVTEFPPSSTSGGPEALTPGPDGNVWFVEDPGNRVGNITPAGQITEWAIPATTNSDPESITLGPDGNLWFTEGEGSHVDRITPAGVLTQFPAADGLEGITTGPDGHLWFVEHNLKKIAKVTDTSGPPASPTPAPPTGTAVPATPPPTGTAVPATPTPPAPPTGTAAPATPTPPGLPTTPPPSCGSFSDVQPSDYFYGPVQYLACQGVISGYADGTFRPYANTTRAQMVKIVVLGFARPLQTPVSDYTFHDVPPTFPFYSVIETAAADNIVAGYSCGGAGEPCDDQYRPYFRPYANVTRGQLAKIDTSAAGWPLLYPAQPTFRDVPVDAPFYPFVETAVGHRVISGYGDQTFRPGDSATRGQIAKIVYLSLPGAQQPTR